MPKSSYKIVAWFTLLACLALTGPAWGWHDKTHMAISQAAGYECWYNSAGPDITKIKAGNLEAMNHWFSNSDKIEVTPDLVLAQVQRYNDPNDQAGHLYGAILHSLRDYRQVKGQGKYAEYHLAFCAHYLGDLSNPLHNAPNDAFNQAHHAKNDDIVEFNVLNNIGFIQRNMYEIKIANETDLAQAVARIANISRQLAYKLAKENRDLTPAEAYHQLAHSASLLKAVLVYARSTP